MGLLMIIGGLVGIIVICLVLSTVFWLMFFLWKTKRAVRYVPDDITDKIESESNKEKEVENVRESRRNERPELYTEQIKPSSGGEQHVETGDKTYPDYGDSKESRDVQLSNVVEVGEPDTSNNGTERDIEEDWPEY